MDALKLRDQRLTPVPFKHFLVVQHAVKLQKPEGSQIDRRMDSDSQIQEP